MDALFKNLITNSNGGSVTTNQRIRIHQLANIDTFRDLIYFVNHSYITAIQLDNLFRVTPDRTWGNVGRDIAYNHGLDPDASIGYCMQFASRKIVNEAKREIFVSFVGDKVRNLVCDGKISHYIPRVMAHDPLHRIFTTDTFFQFVNDSSRKSEKLTSLLRRADFLFWAPFFEGKLENIATFFDGLREKIETSDKREATLEWEKFADEKMKKNRDEYDNLVFDQNQSALTASYFDLIFSFRGSPETYGEIGRKWRLGEGLE